MAKDLSISYLLDFYGQMLTDKQREVTEFYYNDDLSLAEMADHCHITRQGVRDSIKRAEAQLREYEEKLGLARRFVEIQAGLDEITRCAQDISIYNDKFLGSAEVEKPTARICELASQLNDETKQRQTGVSGKGRCLWLLKGFREDFPKYSKS